MGWKDEVRATWESWLPPRPLGERGELAAARYLRRKCGMVIVEHQYQALGAEVDLVAVDGYRKGNPAAGRIVFVEVKTRSEWDAADAVEVAVDAVNDQKQQQITRAALAYLRQHQLQDRPFRFDIIAVHWPDWQKRPSIHHVPDAFPATGKFQLFG